MNKGFKPTYLKSKKNYSTRTFGSLMPVNLPAEYSLNDINFPDQGGTPFCTAYTTTDLCGSEDGIDYTPEFQYSQSLELLNLPPNTAGVDLKTALSVPVSVGLLPSVSAPFSWEKDGQEKSVAWQNYSDADTALAANYKKSAYFFLDGIYDAFDNIRIALWNNRNEKRGMALGIPWYLEYEQVGPSGLPLSGKIQISWHCVAHKGWTAFNTSGQLINGGEVFAKIKSWQGPTYGDKGWLYLSRAEINRIMTIAGAIGGMIAKMTSDVQTTRIGKMEQISGLCQLVIAKMSTLLALLFPPKQYSNG